MTSRMASYQRRVEEWLAAHSPPAVRADPCERAHHFHGEALELSQANGCSRDDAIALIDYVFGRTPGQADQEVAALWSRLRACAARSASTWPKPATASSIATEAAST